MFDIGWPELMVIAVVALIVVGPKDLPKAIYSVGKWVRKARMVAREFQTHLDDMMREAELDELKQQALKARDFNVTRELEKAVDPDGKMKTAFDLPPADTGTAGHAGSPAEDTAAAQPRTATEPPVTAPPEPVAASPAAAPVPQPPATPDKTA
ncbi:Sec-independent protein translocase protein TatB [Azospirillum sp. A39]|uniref:Sec-independent protein translocase protein TatB n=1 Tax=Azospirillum sp. A39 TaxID=3462279 RepID=UPI00404632C4